MIVEVDISREKPGDAVQLVASSVARAAVESGAAEVHIRVLEPGVRPEEVGP